MTLRQTTILLFVCIQSSLWAQTDPEPVGARSGAMANASVTFSDLWSVNNNQAGMANLETIEVGLYYRNRFFVEGLGYQGLAAVYPTKSGVFGVNLFSDGNALYRESKYGLSYGRKLSDIFNLGVQINYHRQRLAQSEYGSNSAFTAEVGILADVTENFTLGAHLFNPTRTILVEDPEERIRTIIKFGGQYTFSDKAVLVAEAVKDMDQDPVFRVGLEYMFMDKVYLRGGIGTEPTLTGFGLGMEVNKLKLEVAALYHNTLGYSPSISISYKIDKRNSPSTISGE